MLKHKIHFDLICFNNRLNESDVEMANKEVVGLTEEINIVDLRERLNSPCSGTRIQAYLESGRKNGYWMSQSLFALDFDSSITFRQASGKFRGYGLDCAFAYQAFSHNPKQERFIIVFQLEKPVSDRTHRDQIQNDLRVLLSESNKSCEKDVVKIICEGEDLIYTNYSYYLDLEKLLLAARFSSVRNTKSEHLNQALKRLDKKSKLCVKNGSHYTYNIESFRFNTKTEKKLQTVNWNELRNKVKILADFMDGELLSYSELLGLASNLMYLNGGEKLFKESCLKSNPEDAAENRYWIGIAKYYDCKPTPLETFSPYKEDHIYVDLLQASRKHGVLRVIPYLTISLTEAEQKLDELFDQVVSSNDTDIHILRVATGLGKTKKLETLEGIAIAVPNHDLKNQVLSRMKVPVNFTPSLPTNLPDSVRERLEYYYSINAIAEANRLIGTEAEINKNLDSYLTILRTFFETEAETLIPPLVFASVMMLKPVFHRWRFKIVRTVDLKQTLSAYGSRDTVLTTHQKGVFIDFDHLPTLVFDEDPISSLLSIGSITVNDLVNLVRSIADIDSKELIKSYIDSITDGVENYPVQSKEISLNVLSAIENAVLCAHHKYDGSILGFFNSDWYVSASNQSSKVYFIKKHELIENKKTIILSATANEWIYRKLYGDRVKFYDVSNVEILGVIDQDTTYSCSRSSLKNEKALKYAQQQAFNLPALTYLRYKQLFSNAVEHMHFGKLSGFDDLSGQNIAIVGTPHLNPIVYSLFAAVLGIDFDLQDLQMRVQVIERNGIEFPLNTYAHEGLRNLHLFFLESEQEQAIGRARPIRYPVLIKLLSSLSHPQACISEEEKQIGRKKLEAAPAAFNL